MEMFELAILVITHTIRARISVAVATVLHEFTVTSKPKKPKKPAAEPAAEPAAPAASTAETSTEVLNALSAILHRRTQRSIRAEREASPGALPEPPARTPPAPASSPEERVVPWTVVT